jgi:hypothetical protein
LRKNADPFDDKGIVKRSLDKERKECAQSVVEGGTPPHCMDECQNKGDKKWAIRNRMKTKGRRKFGGPGDREW